MIHSTFKFSGLREKLNFYKPLVSAVLDQSDCKAYF